MREIKRRVCIGYDNETGSIITVTSGRIFIDSEKSNIHIETKMSYPQKCIIINGIAYVSCYANNFYLINLADDSVIKLKMKNGGELKEMIYHERNNKILCLVYANDKIHVLDIDSKIFTAYSLFSFQHRIFNLIDLDEDTCLVTLRDETDWIKYDDWTPKLDYYKLNKKSLITQKLVVNNLLEISASQILYIKSMDVFAVKSEHLMIFDGLLKNLLFESKEITNINNMFYIFERNLLLIQTCDAIYILELKTLKIVTIKEKIGDMVFLTAIDYNDNLFIYETINNKIVIDELSNWI